MFARKLVKKSWRNFSPKFLQKYRGKIIADRRILSGDIQMHNCIFVHIPKVAGSSIGTALFGHDKPGHIPISRYHKLLGNDIISYLSFSFVRDPIDRFESAYYYLASSPKNQSDKLFASNVISKYDDINDFVDRYIDESSIYSYIHFYPQIYFLKLNGIVAVDFLGRYESLNEDFERLGCVLGLKLELPCVNKTLVKIDNALRYDSKQKLRELYKEDIEMLGY